MGQFPHIAYSELLQRLAKQTNAAVIAAPYQAGLDHFSLAKRTQILFQKALIQCEDDYEGWNTVTTPKYALSHSLGAKLHLISMAAAADDQYVQGAGLVAFNNFGFSGSLSMAKTFLEEFQSSRGNDDGQNQSDAYGGVFDTIFGFAEQAINAAGLEFTPSPSQMEELVRLKLTPELQAKCRLFSFDDDTLDSAESLLDSIANTNDRNCGPPVSGLPGTHLTPVYLKLGLENLDLEDNVREMADQVSDGFQGASFGSEPELDSLVEEIYGWIVGKGVSRSPAWRGGSSASNSRQRVITGGIVDAEIE